MKNWLSGKKPRYVVQNRSIRHTVVVPYCCGRRDGIIDRQYYIVYSRFHKTQGRRSPNRTRLERDYNRMAGNNVAF